MPEHSGELPDDFEDLNTLTLAALTRAGRSEAARGDVLRQKAEVNDLAQPPVRQAPIPKRPGANTRPPSTD